MQSKTLSFRSGPVVHLLLLLFTFLKATAEKPEVIVLWQGKPPAPHMDLTAEIDTTKPGDNLVAGQRVIRTGNVSVPTLTVYRPSADKANGTSVVICPGGGHYILAWDLEGTEVAEWLNELGVTAFVLKYRVPSREREGRRWISAVQDAQRAISIVRSNSEKWQIHPDRIGVLGFSAGGETAALAAMIKERQYEPRDAVDTIDQVPNFNVLIYPGGLTNQDRTGLPDHIQVTPDTPPTFMAHAFDDRVPVEGCLFLMQALKREQVASELHIYSEGGHGYGLRQTETPVTTWHHRCADWMRVQG